MENNKYFKQALNNFTTDVAIGDAIRHLYDLGLSPVEIQKRLDYPASLEKINNIINSYVEFKQASEAGNGYEYIKETDGYGRSSFRRVRK